MAGTNFQKPKSLQHSKTIHRPLISFVALEGVPLLAPADRVQLTTDMLQSLFDTAGRNHTPVPLQISNNIDQMGMLVNPGENRVLVYQNGSQNVMQDGDTGEEIYGRLVLDGKDIFVEFYYWNDEGNEKAYIMADGTYDVFLPYRFSFEKLPDDALIRVKSKRVGDDPENGGGREVMQIITIPDLNTANDLAFMPVPNSFVWGHVDGHSVDSLPGGAFSVIGKTITWQTAVASYDLEPTDRFIVHYETYQ